MAYFPNGSAACDYQERYCFKCRNWRDKHDGRGEGCAVWDLHLRWSYESRSDDTKREALDSLIPDKPSSAGECAMFLPS